MTRIAAEIEWDYEGEARVNLPSDIRLPENIKTGEEILNYLSEQTGFCAKSFSLVQDLSRNEINTSDERCKL